MMSKLSLSFRVRPSILLFGDSITEYGFGIEEVRFGWSSLLSSLYSRRADVLNRGFAGYNTTHAIDVLPSVLGHIDKDDTVRPPFLFCTVFFGANDCSLPTARQYLDIESYDSNIRKIVSEIQSHGHTTTDEKLPIVLITPPPVAAKAWDHYCTVIAPRPLSPRSNENAKKYGKRVISIANEMDCAVVDAYDLLGGDEGEEKFGKYMTDGLHLNEEGNTILYQGLVEVIGKKYPHLLPKQDGMKEGVPLEEKLWSELC